MKLQEKINILLVDDRRENLLALESILGDMGLNQVRALSGREALRQVLAQDFAAILLDVEMPGLDGFETAALIRQRERSRQTPIVFLTAYASPDEKVFKGYQVGAVDYMLKPYIPEILRSKVATFVELFKKTRELSELTRSLAQQVQERTAQLQAKNEELQATTQQLWQAAKLATMGELAASVAHELNNPLAIVTLRIETLLDRLAADDATRRSLEIIDQEVQRMGGLVARLLEFGRSAQPQISTVNVCEEIERTLDLVDHHLRSRGIAVGREYAADPATVHADRQQLRQVFLNLFTNAADAMPRGGTLTLRVATGNASATQAEASGPSPVPAEGPRVISVEVADTGLGIPAENLPKVTDSFFTTKEQGTGLGLAICQRILQEHRGSLSIASEVGKGTTVQLLLAAANHRSHP